MATTDARKPTLLLVHGAWRGAWCWEDLEAELAESAWATQAVELSSALRLRRRTTIPRHARRRTGDPDRTHTHFGTSCRGGTFLWGIPVTQAIGSAANVIGVVYLAAFMLDVGECLLSVTDKSVPDDNAGVIAVTSDMRTAFYSDVADDQTSRAMSELMPQSHGSFAETVTRAGWREMPSAYVVCSNDHSFSPKLQEQFATRAGTVERLASGHSLIFSMPAELARLLSRLALASAAGITNPQIPENRRDMNLLDEVLEAYGGVERWKEVDTIKIHQIVGGVLWTLKNVDGVINDSTVEIRVQEQRAWHRPFTQPGLRSSYSPDRVAIETDDDSAVTLGAMTSPRDSFTDHTLVTPWTMLQLAYFAGYAMWTYLSEPYSLTFPGVQTEELGPWDEDGQVWRRLGVRYPESIGTHSADQVLYVDSDGLLRRRDYEVDIAAGSPAAHYMNDHRESGGIIIPMKRIVHGRDESGHPIPVPVTVSIDIDEVIVS